MSPSTQRIGKDIRASSYFFTRRATDVVSEACFSVMTGDRHGLDFKIKTIELQGKKIKLQIWDTAGQERFHTITSSYYRGVMGVMLVYDITQEKTFDNIPKWLRNIEENAPDVEMMILGNKCHMDDRRVVTKERGEQIAREHGIRFFETSAKTNVNIEQAFYTLAEDILKKQLTKDNEETSQNIRVNNIQEKKSSCF